MLRRILGLLPALLLWLGPALTPLAAQSSEPRIALVIGNGGYSKGPLQNSLNDAGLVAEALRTVGFEVLEGGDLNQTDMTRLFRDYLGKVEAAGPDAVAFIYFSGYGLEFEGENYLVAADARLDREGDVPLDTMRLADILRPLAGAPARAKVVVLDAARRLPFPVANARFARGLAAIEPPPLILVAYSAAPGMIAEDRAGPYGAFATAIAEMVRERGSDLDTMFTRVRSRTHQLTDGKQTPWHVSSVGAPVVLVPPVAPDPVAQGSPGKTAIRLPRPMREIGADEAYAFAIEQDTLQGYVEFVETFPSHPYGPRVWATIRARREALAWMRAVDLNTSAAFWTYLKRYPNGVYAYDAERRLRRLSAQPAPPASFAPVEFFDVPPALSGEPTDIAEVYPPAPPPPSVLIEPPPALFASLPPPPPLRAGGRILPTPEPLPAIPSVTVGTRVPFGTATAIGTPPSSSPQRVFPTGAIHPSATATAPPVRPRSGVRQQRGAGRPGLRSRAMAPTTAPGQSPHVAPPPGTARPAAPAAPSGKPPSDITVGRSPNPPANRPLPPATVRRPPTADARAAAPPVAHAPPPAAAARPSTPPVARVTPPAGAQRKTSPSPAQPPATVQAPKKKCTVVNGVQVCK